MITDAEIINAVATRYEISYSSMYTNRRLRVYAEPRQLCMTLIRLITGKSLAESGKVFMRDHSTVIHSRKVWKNLYQTDKAKRELFRAILMDIAPDDYGKVIRDLLTEERRIVWSM